MVLQPPNTFTVARQMAANDNCDERGLRKRPIERTLGIILVEETMMKNIIKFVFLASLVSQTAISANIHTLNNQSDTQYSNGILIS